MSLAIALTKGRLEKKTIELLEQKGYGIEKLRDKGRQLVFEDTKKDVKYFLVKANDCITYVEHGVADVGVVGKDTLMEGGKDYYELLDLGFGRCKFIVGGMEGKNPLEKTGHVKIGTKYPNVAMDYFQRKGMDIEIIKIDGSVELSPVLGLCDGIVDIMETGATLKENGLVVYDEVADISARLIVNKAAFKTKRAEVMQILKDLERSEEDAE